MADHASPQDKSNIKRQGALPTQQPSQEPPSNEVDSKETYSDDQRKDKRDTRRFLNLTEEFTRDLKNLLNQQSQLLRQELSEKGKLIKTSGITISIGGMFILGGFLTLIAATVFALALFIPWWASSLAIGVVTLVIGVAMVGGGAKRMDAENLKPKKSMETFEKVNDKFQEKVHEYKRPH